MSRNNAAWAAALSPQSAQRNSAVSELRELLLRNLRKALSSYPRADEAFLEDAVQDSLVRILGRLDQFEGRSRFLTWATTIAIRIAMTELRRKRWQDVSLDEVVASPSSQQHAAGPDEQVERNAIIEKMREVIATQLTEKQRTVLTAEMKGMAQVEIARHLGSNRNAVYKLNHDARKKLKQGLEAAGYDADSIQAVFAR